MKKGEVFIVETKPDDKILISKSDLNYLLCRNLELKKEVLDNIESQKEYHDKVRSLEQQLNNIKNNGIWCDDCQKMISLSAWNAHLKSYKHRRNSEYEMLDDESF